MHVGVCVCVSMVRVGEAPEQCMLRHRGRKTQCESKEEHEASPINWEEAGCWQMVRGFGQANKLGPDLIDEHFPTGLPKTLVP